jgi:hypothetical protein
MVNRKRKAGSSKAGAKGAGPEDPTITAPFGTPEATDPILVESKVTPAPAGRPVPLEPGKPIVTTSPQLDVAGMTELGTYVFELVVVDDLGVVSQPVSFSIQVAPPTPAPDHP